MVDLVHPAHVDHCGTEPEGGGGQDYPGPNLAAAAHLGGKRTLVIDLDRQGSALDWYNSRPAGSKLDGLTVVGADRALSMPKFREMSSGYDVIVCDGPPRLGDITRAAAVAADVVLVPLRPGGYDWFAAAETLELLDSADTIRCELGKSPVPPRLRSNGATPKTTIVREMLDAIGGEGELAPVVVCNRVVFARTAHGESVFTLKPNGPAADEMSRLYAALDKHVEVSHG